jgi:hypothetical protein
MFVRYFPLTAALHDAQDPNGSDNGVDYDPVKRPDVPESGDDVTTEEEDQAETQDVESDESSIADEAEADGAAGEPDVEMEPTVEGELGEDEAAEEWLECASDDEAL